MDLWEFPDRMSTPLCIGLKILLIKLDKAECSFTRRPNIKVKVKFTLSTAMKALFL
jgi:hypothetical protein